MVTSSAGFPVLSMDFPGIRILEVGLSARCAKIDCPEEMPPRIPPALFDKNFTSELLPILISSAFSSPVRAALENPAPISTPYTA